MPYFVLFSLRPPRNRKINLAEDPTDTLKAYTETYLKEEIQAEAVVRNLPGFARFLKVAALFHGQEVDATIQNRGRHSSDPGNHLL